MRLCEIASIAEVVNSKPGEQSWCFAASCFPSLPLSVPLTYEHGEFFSHDATVRRCGDLLLFVAELDDSDEGEELASLVATLHAGLSIGFNSDEEREVATSRFRSHRRVLAGEISEVALCEAPSLRGCWCWVDDCEPYPMIEEVVLARARFVEALREELAIGVLAAADPFGKTIADNEDAVAEWDRLYGNRTAPQRRRFTAASTAALHPGDAHLGDNFTLSPTNVPTHTRLDIYRHEEHLGALVLTLPMLLALNTEIAIYAGDMTEAGFAPDEPEPTLVNTDEEEV